jgi:hypothetical protein
MDERNMTALTQSSYRLQSSEMQPLGCAISCHWPKGVGRRCRPPPRLPTFDASHWRVIVPHMASQLTLRGLEPDLQKCLQAVAREERISLNRAAIMLLRKGAGLDEGRKPADTIGHALDEHVGTWTEQEEREFLDSIASCEAIDSSMWQ